MTDKSNCVKDLGRLEVTRYENAIIFQESDVAVISYKQGQVYIGQMNADHLPHGQGLLFLPFCGFVLGSFSHGKADGQAIYKEPNADFGLVTFNNGTQEGKAHKFRWAKGQTSFEDYLHGILRMREYQTNNFFNRDNFPQEFECIAAIERKFKKIFTGKNLISTVNNNDYFYMGCIKRGLPHGIGVKFCRSFEIEIGHFVLGKLNGIGKQIKKNADVIIGSFKDGKVFGHSFHYDYAKKKWFSCNGECNKIEKVALTSCHVFPFIDYDMAANGATFLNQKCYEFEYLDDDIVVFPAENLLKLKRKFFGFENFFHWELLKQGFDDFLYNYFYPCSEDFVRPRKEESKRHAKSRSSLFITPNRKPVSTHQRTELNPNSHAPEPVSFGRSVRGSVQSKSGIFHNIQSSKNDFYLHKNAPLNSKSGIKAAQGHYKPRPASPNKNLVDYYLNQFNQNPGLQNSIKPSVYRKPTDNKLTPAPNTNKPISVYIPLIKKISLQTAKNVEKSNLATGSITKIRTEASQSNLKSTMAQEKEVRTEVHRQKGSNIDFDQASNTEPEAQILKIQKAPCENRRALNSLRNVQSMNVLDRTHIYKDLNNDRLGFKTQLLKEKQIHEIKTIQRNKLESASQQDISINRSMAFDKKEEGASSHYFKLNEETINFTENPSYNYREEYLNQNSSDATDDIILTNRQEGFMTYYKAIRDQNKDVYNYEPIEEINDDYSKSHKSLFFALSQKLHNNHNLKA